MASNTFQRTLTSRSDERHCRPSLREGSGSRLEEPCYTQTDSKKVRPRHNQYVSIGSALFFVVNGSQVTRSSSEMTAIRTSSLMRTRARIPKCSKKHTQSKVSINSKLSGREANSRFMRSWIRASNELGATSKASGWSISQPTKMAYVSSREMSARSCEKVWQVGPEKPTLL